MNVELRSCLVAAVQRWCDAHTTHESQPAVALMIERFIGESPRFRQYLDASEPLDLRHETKGLMPESIGAATSAEAVINTFAKLEAHLGEGVADRACAMYLGGPSASQEDLFDVCAACMTVTNGERAWTGRSVEAALHILTWAMNA